MRLSDLKPGDTFCLATSTNTLEYTGTVNKEGKLLYTYKMLYGDLLYETENNYFI